MATALWFVGLIGLVVATAIASARERAMPDAFVRRGVLASAAIGLVAIAVAAVWIWGGASASRGRALRIAEGAPVSIAVRDVRVPLARGGIVSIGHAATSTVIVPGTGPDELARVELGALSARAPGITITARTTALEAITAGLVCGPGASGTLPLARSTRFLVTTCRDGRPLRALELELRERELVATPLVWRGHLVVERLVVRAGDALRVGAAEPLPGVTTWEVVAPRDAMAMLAVPADPTACETWSLSSSATRRAGGTCVVDVGAFVVEATPLVPDAEAVVARGLRAALVLAGPALALLLALGLSPRRHRRAAMLGMALRLATLSAVLAALATWRLAWAYRIDMLRELAAHGDRLVANELAVVGIGAMLAGLAAWTFARPRSYRGLWLALGWVGWTAIAWRIVQPAAPTALVVGTLGLSLCGALLPFAIGLARTHGQRLTPEVALVAIAVAALVARAAAPPTTLAKLALAYATVLAGHAALRLAIGRDTPVQRRGALLALLLGALLALASYDAGVAVAIAGTGLGFAMLVASHDATYDASRTRQLGLVEREHARLLVVHASAVIAIAITVIASVLAADDRALLVHGPTAIVHAPLVAALLFGLGAIVARSHRRAWAPWLAAALAALAMWGARDRVVVAMTSGDAVASRRVAALVDPGYALLSDDDSFASNVSAWREAAVPAGDSQGPWRGQGAFGARIRDPGVARSIDNDYLAVLVAREEGVHGLARGIALLLALVVGAGAIATMRLPHGSREQRARWIVLGVAGTLVVYQPLAALGVVPLTGISWPGLGIDSPSDLWLFVLGATWCLVGLSDTSHVEDERVRTTPRLVRAHRIVLAALAIAGLAATIVVIRAGVCAVMRGVSEDDRVEHALDYAESLACPWTEKRGALAEAVPAALVGKPTDDATRRFDAEVAATWATARQILTPAVLATCNGRHGPWSLAASSAGCIATVSLGWPAVRLELAHDGAGYRARCSIERDARAIAVVRPPVREQRLARIRVVATALGVAASDAGELVAGARVVRMRPGAPVATLATLAEGLTPASKLALSEEVHLELTTRGVAVRGPAELFVAQDVRRDDAASWQRLIHGGEVVLDRVTLIVAGRTVAVFRPARIVDGKAVTESLLADDTRRLADRARRVYPYGPALPELGWVNPYDVGRSMGLDGWIHAAQRRDPDAPSCGTLVPPAIERTRVCSTSPLDGVLECRVTLQPELVLALDRLADLLFEATTGKQVTPIRVGYVALRGDTGELLAQGNAFAGRAPLAYAPRDAAAEAELMRLREERGESERERVEWNQPIAVGSTLKPIFARAAERAFPGYTAALSLGASGEVTGCRSRRGKRVSPILGHCPPTSVAGEPRTADLHDFLARSPNWYQATLGLAGLALPDGTLAAGDIPISLADLIASDLTAWPTARALRITDAQGTILGPRGLSIAGLRRTPLWTNVEQLLGRPLCTLGDRESCERAADRRDTCAARGLPIASPSADLRYLVALGPDRIDPYADDRRGQQHVPVREYLQLLRGAGVHPVASLPQLADAFNRVVFDPATGPSKLAASWFPAPVTGTLPTWSCADGKGHLATVHGADGGLCGVLRDDGTAAAAGRELMAIENTVIYGAKTGTIDSLADVARRPSACRAWNARHPAAQLACGKAPPDDSLFVISFGIVTPSGTVPVTLALQLQRGGPSSAARAAPAFVRAIARYLRGA